MNGLRYVFFGTPRFGRIVLEELLHAGLTPLAVVANPDKPQGRRQIITPPPVKQLIEEQGLSHVKVFQPARLSDIREELAALQADVFVVAAYGKILKKEVLEMPPHGTVGVHPSLLPKYRGVAPIQGALLDGLQETGVSLFVVDEEVDHGPVVAEEKVVIEDADNYLSLEEKLARSGGKLLAKVLPDYVSGKLSPAAQAHEGATFTKKFTTEDAFIVWEKVERAMREDVTSAVRIHNMIRALNPEPGVWTLRDDKRLKLLRSSLSPEGVLVLEEVQREGKKPSPWRG